MVRLWVGKLASLKFTLFILALLGIGIIVSYRGVGTITWALVLPLFLFSLNILAAILTNPVFRRQMPLLMFHLALIAIVLLAAVGRLTYLKGTVEVVEGGAFSSQMVEAEKGPWHWGRLDQIFFTNEGFSVEYAPEVIPGVGVNVEPGNMVNKVRWRDEQGREQRSVIGDMVPLTLYGYHFYANTKHKGFAPTFVWRPAAGGPPVLGAVHLPSYPLHEYKQAQTWTPPGSKTAVWVLLQFDEVILDPQKPSEFRLPAEHQLVVRVGEERHPLRPGESLRLADGVLQYNGLRSWMGYTIFYDFTLHWLLAASVLAVGSMAVHFWRKYSARPWDR